MTTNRVLLAYGSHYIGYQLDNVLFTKPLWLHIKLWKQDNRFIYVTCFIIINQLVLWDPPVNYYSISRRQGSTFNPRLSLSLHRLSGTLCLHLLKVPPPSRHIWKQNCSLLHTTQSNISSGAGASNSNSQHMAPPINFLIFDIWHLSDILDDIVLLLTNMQASFMQSSSSQSDAICSWSTRFRFTSSDHSSSSYHTVQPDKKLVFVSIMSVHGSVAMVHIFEVKYLRN